MKNIYVKCKTISPMFNGRGKEEFDLLPQSVRGVMRFWFRATAPNIIGEDVSNLRKLEEYIFGSTERKSAFDLNVKLKRKNEAGDKNIKKREKNLQEIISKDSKYGYYGAENNEYFLSPDTNFLIEMFIKKEYEELEKFLYYILNFVSIFGGIGMKSRKGFGSFEILRAQSIKKTPDEENTEELIKINNLYHLEIEYEKSLKKLINNINNEIEKEKGTKEKIKTGNIKDNIHDFPVYFFDNGKNKENLESENFKSLNELFKSLYNMTRDQKNLGNYIKIKRELRGKGTEEDSFKNAIYKIESRQKKEIKFKQAIMGLPVNYKIIKGQFERLYSGNYTLKSEENRKASPVFISVHKNSGGYFYRVIILKSKISENNDINLFKNKTYVGSKFSEKDLENYYKELKNLFGKYMKGGKK